MKIALETTGVTFYSETGNLDTQVYAQTYNDAMRESWTNGSSDWWEHLAGDVWRTRMFTEE